MSNYVSASGISPSWYIIVGVNSTKWNAPNRCFATASVQAHRDDMIVWCYIDGNCIGKIAAFDTTGKRDDFVAWPISFFINQGSVFSTNYTIERVTFWPI